MEYVAVVELSSEIMMESPQDLAFGPLGEDLRSASRLFSVALHQITDGTHPLQPPIYMYLMCESRNLFHYTRLGVRVASTTSLYHRLCGRRGGTNIFSFELVIESVKVL